MEAGQHMGEGLQSNPGQQHHQTNEENLSEDRMRRRHFPHLNTDFLYVDFVQVFLQLHTKFPVDVCVFVSAHGRLTRHQTGAGYVNGT